MERRILHKILALFFIFIFPIVITMCGGGNGGDNSLSGRITTSNGIGLSGVTVILSGVYAGCSGSRSTTTDANGYYSFTTDFLYSGSGTLTPYHQGYIFTPTSRSVSSLGSSGIGGQDFMATPLPLSISGTVMTASGMGIAGITVKLSGAADAITVTDANGGYKFAGLLKGSYILVPSQLAPGYDFTPPERTVNINYQDVTGQDFTITTYVLSGRVTNNTGIGFSGVNITLSGTESLSTTSDAAGYYSFIVFQPGPYTITPSMSAPGYTFTPAERTVTITSADITGQDFLTVAYTIAGRVTTSEGAGVSGITVSVLGPASLSSLTEANGDYAVAVVQSGSYTITPSDMCSAYSYTPAAITTVVSATDVMGQNFTATAIPHSISGRVTTPSGDGASGVTVNLSDADSMLATTDADGGYAFTVTRSGSYTLIPLTLEAAYAFRPIWRNLSLCGADITGQDFEESITWEKLYGSGILYSIQTTSDKGYIAAGSSYGKLQVFKLNPNGSILWQKSYDGGEARSIRETDDNGFIITGITSTFGAGGDDLWVLKLDASGIILWQNAYGSTSAEKGNSIFPTKDGGYVVAGSYGTSTENEMWVLRLDINGTVVWQKSYGKGWISSVRETSDGGYIAAGTHIMKLDANGDRIWQKSYSGTANSIQQATDNGFIVAGYTSVFGSGSNDLWVLRIAGDGSVIWQKAFGESDDESAQSVQSTSAGGYIVAGSKTSHVILLKLNSEGNISWQMRYGDWPLANTPYSLDITMDGNYILAGFSSYFGVFPTVLKIDSTGEGCKMYRPNLTMTSATASPVDFADPVTDTGAVKTVTTSVSNNTAAATSQVCP